MATVQGQYQLPSGSTVSSRNGDQREGAVHMKPDSFDIVYQPGLPLRFLVYAVYEGDRWYVGSHFSKARALEVIETTYKNVERPAGIGL